MCFSKFHCRSIDSQNAADFNFRVADDLCTSELYSKVSIAASFDFLRDKGIQMLMNFEKAYHCFKGQTCHLRQIEIMLENLRSPNVKDHTEHSSVNALSFNHLKHLYKSS